MLHGSSLPRERAGTRFSRFERRAAVSRAVRNCHARCLPDPTSRFIGARETNGNTHEGFLRDGTPRRARKALASSPHLSTNVQTVERCSYELSAGQIGGSVSLIFTLALALHVICIFICVYFVTSRIHVLCCMSNSGNSFIRTVLT